MIQKERGQVLKEKTTQIKRATRQKQLDMRFNSIRKHMIRAKTERQLQQKRQQQTYVIGQLLNRLEQNESNAIYKLWQHCLSFSFRYLSQKQILFLVTKIKEITQQLASRSQDIIMGVWLISNWATTVVHLKENFDELIALLNGLLDENISQKLEQYILYTFVNLCTDLSFAKKLIKMTILEKILDCHSFRQKEGDVALLLRNCLQVLPTQYRIQVGLTKRLLIFVKSALRKCQQDYFLRADCFCIITKLINAKFQSPLSSRILPLAADTIISQLGPQLKSLVLTLESITEVQSCRQMFSMLTNIAKISSSKAQFFDQSLEKSIWTNTKSFLSLENSVFLQEKQEFYELITEIYKFLPFFIVISDQTLKQQILQWLLEQCLFGENVEWQEKALVILAQNLTNPEEIIQLCEAKLQNFKVLDQPTYAMLLALQKAIANDEALRTKLKHREELRLFLSNLQFDDRQEIAKQAKNIMRAIEETTQDSQAVFGCAQTTNMQEELQTKRKHHQAQN